MAQVQPGNAQLAFARRQQAAKHAEDGGFAGAVGTEETENLATPHRKAYAIDGPEVPEATAQCFNVDDRLMLRSREFRLRGGGDTAHVCAGDAGLSMLAQQVDECIFEARRHRCERCVLQADLPD